jgi:Tfp pilus assembly protein PilX
MKRMPKSQAGAALPFVLIILALNVVVVVAMLAYTTTEYQASRNSVQAETSRALAQSGIDLAAALVSANSTNNAFVTYQRVTNVGSAWRLETKIANVVATNAAQPWKTAVTNPVILHSGFATGTNGFDLNYAADASGSAGFIAPRTNLTGWTNLSTNMFRMDWIYVYRGNNSDPTNLIGRIAYWVDDESSKLNVNYSGSSEVYGTGFNNSQPIPISIKLPRPGIPLIGSVGNLNGRNWPLDMELGGIAGLSIANVKDAIAWRKRPDQSSFNPFPSVLGLRIGTINGTTGPAITNLSQQ